MPAPISVELKPYDPAWYERAHAEAARVIEAAEGVIVTVHHVGSTSIPGIMSKPIIDLMPALLSQSKFDNLRPAIEALGYEWWGEYGLEGRRYCTLDDPASGKRLVQLHCFERGSAEIKRHLAFRDYLRSNPAIAAEYEMEKRRCAALHPFDSHLYSDCKGDWIQRVEALAFANWKDG